MLLTAIYHILKKKEPYNAELYSDKASRPNSPINVIIGLLIIIEYDLKQNIHSNSKFADDVIANLASKNNDSNCKLLVGGAYYSQEKAKNALKQGIEIVLPN
ncbi:hypothetical protein CLSAP_46860 [Clostridium saccharoperbutylacetonicum]|nr:hypothetical protein CLSAP_46860 [Clostridium saccharoperbutylacetonicum]NSB33245.1 hypothetical protein [Clostridium saccharoperbutylacetonicum]